MWWKEPRQSTQWDLIEGVVGHTNPAWCNRIFLATYRMTYPSFLNLVLELEPYVRSNATQFVRAPVSMEKMVVLVLYKFAPSVNACVINVGASTVRKYVAIVVDAPMPHEKLFDEYIYILHEITTTTYHKGV